MHKLFETYSSQKELEKLSVDILLMCSKKTLEYVNGVVAMRKNNNQIVDKRPIWGLSSIYLTDIYKDKSKISKYDTITEFIKTSEVTIRFDKKINDTTTGSFILPKYSETNRPEIEIYHDVELLTFLNDNYDDGKISQDNDIYYAIYDLDNVILHELIHAYDYWRSGGKAIKIDKNTTKDNIKRKVIKMKHEDGLKLSKEELDFINKNFNDYLNKSYEIDARFAQTIKKISPYSLDWDAQVYSIISWDEYYKSFKLNMIGWNVMSDKNKKRLIRKLSQFYYFEKEYLPTKNEKLKKINNDE